MLRPRATSGTGPRTHGGPESPGCPPSPVFFSSPPRPHPYKVLCSWNTKRWKDQLGHSFGCRRGRVCTSFPPFLWLPPVLQTFPERPEFCHPVPEAHCEGRQGTGPALPTSGHERNRSPADILGTLQAQSWPNSPKIETSRMSLRLLS